MTNMDKVYVTIAQNSVGDRAHSSWSPLNFATFQCNISYYDININSTILVLVVSKRIRMQVTKIILDILKYQDHSTTTYIFSPYVFV